MTKKEITESILDKIDEGEDRPLAIAAEILDEYRTRMLPVIEEEAAKLLKKAKKQRGEDQE